MNSDWEEIKRLAADFQKVQLTSTLQKLSERNCVEIVTLLAEKGLIDVVYTNDGKEYITPEHLEREILDDLYMHGGRVNLVELSKDLNVDLSKINKVVEKIAAEHKTIHFLLGQLIDEDYITRIATEINEKLTQNGEISISDLTAQFDLPTEFLQRKVVEKHLGKIIRGRQDPNNPRILFTQAYIARCKAKIRGGLAALTRPTPVSAILQQINIQERIFHSLIEEIAPAGNVTSKISSAQYIPHIYAKMQTNWVNSFYNQNGFLEYDSISKLGISDPKQFIKKQFPSENITFLKRCAVGPKITELTFMTAINECHVTKSYVDLSTLLPSIMSPEDIEELFTTLVPANAQSNYVFLDNVVFSKQYLNQLIEPCNAIATANAKTAIESGAYQQYVVEKQIAFSRSAGNHDEDIVDVKADRRDERRKKAATGKGGGGTQGRETKTKSTKKHTRGADKAAKDSDDEDSAPTRKGKQSLELVSSKDIKQVINNKLEEEGLDHLTEQIAKLYHMQINNTALSAAQSLFEANPQGQRRQTHASLQEKLNVLLVDIRLYEKGLKLLPADTQPQLVKYLLKSLGTDICNEITLYVANECNLNIKNSSNLTVEQRNKIAQECDPEYKTAIAELNKSLNKTIDDFLVATEEAMKVCSMIIKKIDKKKDRSIILQHKDKLCQQVKETEDPAIILHLVVLILFTSCSNAIIHASGKFVSNILQYLQPHLNADQNNILKQFHDLVLKLLIAGSDSDEAKNALEELKDIQKSAIELALNFEKPGIVKAD